MLFLSHKCFTTNSPEYNGLSQYPRILFDIYRNWWSASAPFARPRQSFLVINVYV